MTEQHILIRNDERYPPGEAQLKRNPERIIVKGSLAQASHVAEQLSLFEAGCDYYYYVKED